MNLQHIKPTITSSLLSRPEFQQVLNSYKIREEDIEILDLDMRDDDHEIMDYMKQTTGDRAVRTTQLRNQHRYYTISSK